VGDWVAVCDAAGGRYAIEAVLPRRTKISRKTPWLEAEEHVLAANVGAVLIVSRLDGDFNPRRLERYLTAAWDSGADPVVVLTKLDLLTDERKLVEAEEVALGVPVLVLSNVTGEGVEELRALLRPRHTFVLLGSSGAGKSTLVNRLAGRELMRPGSCGATGAAATRPATGSCSSSPAVRSSSTRWACASSRCGRETSTAPSRRSPGARSAAASPTALTRPGRAARYGRRWRRARLSSRERRELKRRWRSRARESRRARRSGGQP